jgi:putative ABC transport system permease protein
MSGVWSDLQLAVRLLAKDRRFTVAAIIALGLGIGLNTSVFAIVNATFLRDLPFDEPDRLIAIQLRDARAPLPGRDRGLSTGGVVVAPSYADLREWREHTSAFEGLAANRGGGALNLSDDGLAAERFTGSYVTANTFRLLQVAPILGRDFVDQDDEAGAPAVVMLGYGVWQTRYGGDPSVVGRSIRVNDAPATIIGVMPRGFKYPFIDQAWLAISSAPNFAASTARNLSILGRLKPSVELAQARAELDAIVAGRPEMYKDLAPFARPLRELYPYPPTAMIAMMVGAVGFVLLIAYANLANLLLARSVGRAREIAVRTALGASRFQLIRQLLIECLMIAIGGAVLGLALSIYGANEIAIAFEPIQAGVALGSNRPYWVNLSPDTTVFLFVALLAVTSALAFGLLPAWQISKTDVHETLKEEGRSGGGSRGRRWSAVLLTAELALALVLLTGAGLLWRGFIERYREETVIDTSGVVTMRLTLPGQKYAAPADRKRFLEQLNQRLSAMTVFSSVTMASHVPLEFGAPARELYIDGVETAPGDKPPVITYLLTGDRYFETLELPIVRGRAIEAADSRAGQEGAVVDERFVTRFFASGDVIGRRIRVGAQGVWYTIVGVARTVPQFGPPPETRPVVYAPLQAEPAPEGRAAIIVKGPLAAASATLREEVRAMDSTLPLFAIETLETTRARGRIPARVLGVWFGALAVVALILAGVGVFAITAHNVAQRTHEVGVRMALGADAREVVRLFVRRTLIQLAIGIVFGLAGALAVGRVLQASLREVGERDPVTFTIVTMILATVTLVATLLPARRATRVDPMIALRTE